MLTALAFNSSHSSTFILLGFFLCNALMCPCCTKISTLFVYFSHTPTQLSSPYLFGTTYLSLLTHMTACSHTMHDNFPFLAHKQHNRYSYTPSIVHIQHSNTHIFVVFFFFLLTHNTQSMVISRHFV